MGKPKRHHWWPMTQSRHWTGKDGNVTVTRADGSSFKTNPVNIGVESELYTRFLEDGTKDTSVEEWFAQVIDTPASTMIEHLLDSSNVTRTRFQGHPEKVRAAKAVGFRVPRYIDRISTPVEIRQSIADYVAALLVRHPRYLARLINFNKESSASDDVTKSLGLDNMLRLYAIYRERIAQSVFIVTKRVGSSEYLYADGGLVVEEPWRRDFGIPFDIHAPITPDIALQILPVPSHFASDLTFATVAESTNQGVSRQNRIILGGARRFVFSREEISPTFIAANFGKPAAKNIGIGMTDGRFETLYDPTRR